MQDRIYQFEPLWGEWKVDKLIGEGSFGKVYKVKRTEFGEDYFAAVKIITIPQNETEIKHAYSEGMDENSVKTYFENFAAGLLKEIRLMASLKGNTNVVSLEDYKIVEKNDGIGWDILIRMELLKSFVDYISEKTLSKRDIIKLGIDMCKALELCQKANIIHRDIKPDNIFVSPHGDFKLGDFGIARQIEKTTSGLSKKGTFTYMAPEVYKGEAYNSTVDIYSLGLVLYRLLNNNRTPFLPDYPAQITHTSREESLIKRISGDAFPMPVNADGRLAEIVLKACSFKPIDRYENPILMREALESIQYQVDEAPLIYPMGDKVDNKSVDYISTNEPVKPGNDPTESILGQNISKPIAGLMGNDKTESIFEQNIPVPISSVIKEERTESIFGQHVYEQQLDKTESMFSSAGSQTPIDKSTNISESNVPQSFERQTYETKSGDHLKSKKRIIIGIGAAICLALIIVIPMLADFYSSNKQILVPTSTPTATTVSISSTAPSFSAIQSNTQSSSTSSSSSTQQVQIPINAINVGDYVSFGTYNGEQIIWRVVDKSNGAMLVSEYILCFKAFDAAESGNVNQEGGSYTQNVNYQKYGSNVWNNSNICEWLNSSDQRVTYSTQPPTNNALNKNVDAYTDEVGFLYNFTQQERNAIKEVPHDNVNDKVYLLSLEEWHNIGAVIGKPTSAAINNDKYFYHGIPDYSAGTQIAAWNYWLRTPSTYITYDSSETYVTTTDGVNYKYDESYYDSTEAYQCSGVLPVLNLKSATYKSGKGTINDPFIVT